MTDEETTAAAATVSGSPEKIQTAIQSLFSIVPSLNLSTTNPLSLLHDPNIYTEISTLLRDPNSGAGDNNLCRWLYDTFQSGDPELHLLVLRFLPVIAGVYLSRVADRKPQAGFEAVLLALYAHETTSRGGEPVTVTIPDMSHPSIYHESKAPSKNNATELNVAVVSPALEPHGTVRSTRRARIVGVAFELFYSKISQIPSAPKIDFCDFCKVWAGQDGEMYKDFEEESESEDEEEEVGGENCEEEGKEEHGVGEEKQSRNRGKTEDLSEEKQRSNRGKTEGRVPLPWELLQPVMRILGHCLLGPSSNKDMELFEAASEACRSLFARAMHDVNPNAILPMRSLLRLSKSVVGNHVDDFDPTELPKTDVITL
ncbi:uncharacterized protein LOC130733387 [Lotus japonicus]|uniref:uncharacterized protein LOC130733387 n=1 Tax=Lotus japonicus TaxID=34305 RepID=UPI002588C31B|nr:uncharacterized protein LOC130733387 [Lotus japonicus]